MFVTELEFQSALIRRLKKMGMYVRNIPDIGNTKKPFDISINYNGLWGALELKIIKTKKEPTDDQVYKKLYPHQVANLREFQNWKSQWISWIIAYHGYTNSIRFYILRDGDKGLELYNRSHWPWESDHLENLINLIFKK